MKISVRMFRCTLNILWKEFVTLRSRCVDSVFLLLWQKWDRIILMWWEPHSLFVFRDTTLTNTISHVCHACYIPRPSHPPWFDHRLSGEEYELRISSLFLSTRGLRIFLGFEDVWSYSSFSSVDSFQMLYFTLVTSRLEYASVVWSILTSADDNKLERNLRKCLALCYNSSFPQIHYRYVNDLHHINFHTLWTKRRNLDALFLVNVYNGFKFCPSLLETVGIHVSVWNFKDFRVFTIGSSHRTCRYTSAANTVCKIPTYLVNIWLHLIIF
jgi:hypothetical protein